jgi:hypothetical protein
MLRTHRRKLQIVQGTGAGLLAGYAGAYTIHPFTMYGGMIIILFTMSAMLAGRAWLYRGRRRRYSERLF